MAVHVLRHSQVVPVGLEASWDFFSDPGNLGKLTPPALELRLCGEPPPRIHPGLMIQYRVRPLWGVPVTWLTEITQVEPLRYFVDEQRVGPYAVWHHEHFFDALDSGRTEIRDVVHYVLPFGWLGNLAHPFLVAPELRNIFEYRRKTIEERFGGT